MSKAKTYKLSGLIMSVCFAILLAFLPRIVSRDISIIISIVAVIGIVAGIMLWRHGKGEQVKENYQLIKRIPILINEIDKRRTEIIKEELDKRMSSGDKQFVFNMMDDAWLIITGDNPPKLKTETGNGDIERIGDVLKYTMESKEGMENMRKKMKELGDMETGLVLARLVNKYLGIDEKIAEDTTYKELKLARELLPGDVAVDTTKAIDSYLNYSRAYRATDALTMPLIKMLEGYDFIGSIAGIKQAINMFDKYKENCIEQMNINQAQVNEALKLL